MNMIANPDTCASEILEVVPQVMRTIRREMRSRRAAGLSIPQFRALIFINRQQQAALVEVSEHIGLTGATTCRMMDELVGRGLILSRPSTVDRRKIVLTITEQGREVLEAAHAGTLARLEDLLRSLQPAQRAAVTQAMGILRQAFASDDEN
jgi:DNA-binding MarR family transcriptional regulator